MSPSLAVTHNRSRKDSSGLELIHRPVFKPHYSVYLTPDGVVLLSEKGRTLLRGRLYSLVAPLVDGQRTDDEIATALEDHTAASEVFYALSLLEQKGYISEASERMPRAEAAFWSLQDRDPDDVAQRLERSVVAVQTFGAVDAESVKRALDQLRVRIGGDAPIGVVIVDDYQREELRDYNREALLAGRPWFVARLTGLDSWIGPLFTPGQTGCWECLEQRLKFHRSRQIALDAEGTVIEAFASTQPAREVAANVLAGEVARWIGLGQTSLAGKLLSFNHETLTTTMHTLVHRPQCGACGSPADEEMSRIKPVTLQSHAKSGFIDGGYRAVSPEETLSRLSHHVSPITGVVTELERAATPHDGVTHVYTAGHNMAAQQGPDLESLRHLRKGSAGKGMSAAQAKAGALCEALERVSGLFDGTEPRRTARLGELGDLAVHPKDLLLYSDRQFQERVERNARPSAFNWIAEAFDEERAIDWSPVYSMSRSTVCYVPTAFAYYRYKDSVQPELCQGDSNGNASGNSIEEAILQGFLELVERDAVALWWYNRIQKPALDISTVDEPYLQRHAEVLRSRGRETWILDLTSDLGIPVYAAVSRQTHSPRENILFGFGAHLDAKIAAVRAVTEMNQMLIHIPSEDAELSESEVAKSEMLQWLTTASVTAHPYLAPLPDAVPLPPSVSTYDDLRDDVLLCQSIVERHGMEMLVLDQTRPDLQIPVVKVIVPGLRHFWARFAPGRLYDVPAKMGWLDAPLTEGELNPVAMFL